MATCRNPRPKGRGGCQKAVIRNPVYQAMSEADKNAIKQAIFNDVTCLNVRFCENYLKDDVRLVHLNGYLQFLLSDLDKKEYNAPVGESQIDLLATVAMHNPYKDYTVKNMVANILIINNISLLLITKDIKLELMH